MTKKIGDYSIGIDLGTGSVGWAVIDENYKLLKLNGKDAWGAYIFDDAKTAVDTRTKRSQRRRYERRAERIRLLQDIMAQMVLSVDDSFFIKLKESYLCSDEQKRNLQESTFKRSNHYNLFEGEFNDRIYYKQYPTIYHLRNALAKNTEKADARLVYLALHHIIKYRGNFLYEGKDISGKNGALLKENVEDFFNLLENEYNVDLHYVDLIDDFCGKLQDKEKSKKQKENELNKCFNDVKNKKVIQAFIKAILGYTVKLADLLMLENATDEAGKAIQFSFSASDYDVQEDILVDKADGRENIIFATKNIYYAVLFESVKRGKNTISEAMIDKYEKHKQDLKEFKACIKECFPIKYDEQTGKIKENKYAEMFRYAKGVNYVNYIGTNQNGVHYKEKVSYDDFIKSVKSLLQTAPENEYKTYCLKQIELGEFLPKINSIDNAGIPYQMNMDELNAILQNQGEYYPCLKENENKIKAIFEFKRPYYAGTLKGKFSWCNQKINEKVTPWNFYDLVDPNSLQENFITRMTNRCNYFAEEEALPLNSIVYSAQVVLNEINKLKFQDSKYPISIQQKQKLFALCCAQKKVTAKDIVKCLNKDFNDNLKAENIFGLSDSARITASMVSIVDFKRILGDDFNINKLDCYEETIRTLTIFTDDKVKKERIAGQKFADKEVYSESQVKALCKLQYKGWGRYSMKFLNGILGSDNKTIVQMLYETNYHINELVMDKEDKFGFKANLPVNDEVIDKFDYKKHIKDLYCSPSVKKSIWNALKIIEEVEKVSKVAPTRIFIESTKEDNEKKATQSRVKRLSEIYNSIKNEEYFNPECEAHLNELENKDLNINADKFYLWLIQLGKSMYSNATIHFEEIDSCQIDHIVPRCYIKDDSFENRVLVKTIENQRKADTLGLQENVISNMKHFWKFLYDKKLIGSKKYKNLQKTEYDENEQIGFINRQLVETNQIVKQTKLLLEQRYPNAVIQCVKAGMNSQIRKRYSGKAGFYKIRSLNNMHHAKDAYLTAFVGQFTNVACPMWGQSSENYKLKYYIKNPSKYIDRYLDNQENGDCETEQNDKYKDSRKVVQDLVNKRYGLIIDLMNKYDDFELFADDETGELLWDEQKYNNVFETMKKNNCLIVKKKLPMANTEFYNQTIFGINSGKEKLIPLKTKNGEAMPICYGGYSNENSAYFAVLKMKTIKKKQECVEYKFAGVPVRIAWQDKGDFAVLIDYFKQKYNNDSIEIIKIIKKFQKIIYNGHSCYITGEDELNNAFEFYVKPEYEKMLYQIDKYNASKKDVEEAKRTFKELEKSQTEYTSLIKNFIKDYCFVVRKTMPLYENFADKCDNILNEYYDKMKFEDKIDFVINMLKVSNTGAGRFDIPKEFGGGSAMGRLSGKTINPNEVTWIDLSCTGLYEKVVKGVE